jgi:hypothetical protein
MRTSLLALALASAVAIPVLVLDLIGLFDDVGGPTWHYDDADMRAAVEGTWEMTTVANGVHQKWTIEVRQAGEAARSERSSGLVRSAAACGSRSFVRSAHACESISGMPLEVAVQGRDQPAYGHLMVFGTRFAEARLDITIGTRDHQITGTAATIDAGGNVIEMSSAGGSLVRIKR